MKACLERRKVMSEEFLVKWGQGRVSFFRAKGIKKMHGYQEVGVLKEFRDSPTIIYLHISYMEYL